MHKHNVRKIVKIKVYVQIRVFKIVTHHSITCLEERAEMRAHKKTIVVDSKVSSTRHLNITELYGAFRGSARCRGSC